MLQKTTHWITDRLLERAIPAVGSFMASALQRMLIVSHAEHHDQLEEQARKYEADGKPHLADLIRREAQRLTLDDPFSQSSEIRQQLASDADGQLALPMPSDGSRSRKGTRRRKTNRVEGTVPAEDAS